MPEHNPSTPMQQAQAPQKQESLLANLAFNVIIPSLILNKLSREEYLGPTMALIVALAFPILFGLRDFVSKRKYNFFSILGFVSILLTGGISLLKLPAEYIAIKEASIPLLFAIATLVSLKTPFPLVRTLVYTPAVFDTAKVTRAVEANNAVAKFEQLLVNSSLIIAASFLLSAVLNYVLAVIMVTADAGTAEFNEQLGKMTFVSYFVIMVPSVSVLFGAVFYLFRGIKRLTGLTFEEVINDPQAKAQTNPTDTPQAEKE